MNILEELIHIVLPYIIHTLEILGIFIVTWSAVKAFWRYIHNAFTKRKIDLQTRLANGLATGLEFKMAAEILKTVIVQSLDELYVLGAIVLLRALISALIHFEYVAHGKRASGKNAANTTESGATPADSDTARLDVADATEPTAIADSALEAKPE